MQLTRIKTAIVGAWILGVSAIGLSADLGSLSGWTLLVGLGLLPPLVLLWMWKQPAPTMSENIRNVLR